MDENGGCEIKYKRWKSGSQFWNISEVTHIIFTLPWYICQGSTAKSGCKPYSCFIFNLAYFQEITHLLICTSSQMELRKMSTLCNGLGHSTVLQKAVSSASSPVLILILKAQRALEKFICNSHFLSSQHNINFQYIFFQVKPPSSRI